MAQLVGGCAVSRRNDRSRGLVHAAREDRHHRYLFPRRPTHSVVGRRAVDIRHHAQFADVHGDSGANQSDGCQLVSRPVAHPARRADGGNLLPAVLPQARPDLGLRVSGETLQSSLPDLRRHLIHPLSHRQGGHRPLSTRAGAGGGFRYPGHHRHSCHTPPARMSCRDM
jgi:hypothetical protein